MITLERLQEVEARLVVAEADLLREKSARMADAAHWRTEIADLNQKLHDLQVEMSSLRRLVVDSNAHHARVAEAIG